MFDDLSPQARQAIAAVIVGVLGIFFLFSLLGYAGMAGEVTNDGLTWLFGTGAWLAPVTCLFYVIALMRPREDERVSAAKIVGISLFFFSTLALLSLYAKDLGGMSGELLTWPLSYLFGTMVAGVILVAFVLIGTFLIFNTGIGLPAFLKRDPNAEELLSEEDDLGLDGLDLPELTEPATPEKPAEGEKVDDDADVKKGIDAMNAKVSEARWQEPR